MKKLKNVCLIILFGLKMSVTAYSQGFEVNNFTFTGRLSLNSTKFLGESKTNYSFGIGSGLFITDKTRLGLNFGATNIADIQDNFSIDVNARIYSKAKNRFSLFGNGSFGYEENEADNIKSNSYKISVSPGLNYFITENLAIEATFGELSYSIIKPNKTIDETMQKFNFGLDLTNLTFGILLRRK
jgi:hypothetical protein